MLQAERDVFVEKSKLALLWSSFCEPLKNFAVTYNIAKKHCKTAIILQLLLPGLGNLLHRQIEKGITRLLGSLLYVVYMFTFGWKHLFGIIHLDYFSLSLLAVLISAIYVTVYYFALRDIVSLTQKLNKGMEIKRSVIVSWMKRIRARNVRYWRDFANTYYRSTKVGKVNLSLSFLFIGYGAIVRKQCLRGLFYCASQILFLSYFFFYGYQSIKDLIQIDLYVGDRRQPLIFGVITLIMLMFFVVYYVYAQRTTLHNEQKIVNKAPPLGLGEEISELSNDKAYRLSLVIPILGALVFTIVPLTFMILLAFTDFNLAQSIGQNRFTWAGFQSFQQLFDSGTNLKALVSVIEWTFIWAFFATFTTYFGGLFIALLFQRKHVKLKPLWRSLLVIAMAVPQFVSLRVMYSMFDTYGPINTLLVNWGWIESTARIDFWGSTTSAKSLIILINMWVGIPYNMLLMSGLIINIPQDYYEAAKIEGASKWQIFRKITFPYIWYLTTPVLITGFVHNINNFNVIWLLTKGGPLGGGTGGSSGGTDILITWLYRLTMYNQNVAQYNLGSAIGILMFIISASVSLLVYRRSLAYKNEAEFRQ